MRSTLLLLACLGCADPEDTGTLPSGTPAGTTTEDWTVRCAAQKDNRLRYDCAIVGLSDGPISVSWQTGDGPMRSLVSETTGTEHSVTLYGMKSGREVVARFEGPDGEKTRTFTPGPVPSSLSSGIEITGTGSTPVLVALPCLGESALAIIDVDGEALWYQNYTVVGTSVVNGGYEYTPQGTILAAFGDNITEITLAGVELRRWTRGVDFPDLPVHHDVHRGANGLTYALFAEQVSAPDGEYVMDGVFVFDDSGLVATWHLSDHVVPTGEPATFGFWNAEFPGATDFSHGNSVTVAADGSMYISLRWLSTGMKIDGDPSSPTFGAIDWQLVGDATSPLVSDFSLSTQVAGPADFIGQHHVNPTPDGRLALFDNRTSDSSRGLILALDPGAGTAVIEEAWDIGWVCSAQGANHVLANGNALLTCGPSGRVHEYAPGNPDPVWTFKLTCGTFTMVPRGVPAPI